MSQVEAQLAEQRGVAGFFAAVGLGFGEPPSASRAAVFTRLEPWGEREVKQQEIVAKLFPRFMAIPQALVFAINPPSLGQRTTSDVEIVVKASAASLEELASVNGAILGRVRQLGGLVNVDSDLRLDSPELDLDFDRERAGDVGVPIRAVAESLRLLFAQGESDEFVLRNKQYDVVTALASRYRAVPDQIDQVYVRARDDRMVPLGSLVQARAGVGPSRLNHYDLQRSATLTAKLAPGATLDEALERVRAIVDEELPRGFSTTLGGISREYVESAGQIYQTFAVALLVIYLVLAAQFESFVHPLTVMLSVPLATLGALATLAATGNTWNLYSQIGMILLVGLVTKNSILLVDFANQARARGADLLEALREAGRVRFRPILMTSTTSVLGALPLALATGAGAESRHPIGVAVVGGLFFSTVFTLVVIPVVHYAVTRAADSLGLETVPPLVELDGEG